MKPHSNLWQQLPETAVRRLQAERLHSYLRTVVLPFSPYYKKLFREHGLAADSIRTLEDLGKIPFTSKTDLLNTKENPQRFRDFILVPDQKVLARRPGTIFRALTRGREFVREEFEAEFRPIFMTFTTGRAAEPVPFLYTRRDLAHLTTAGRRIMEVCAARREERMMNAFPYAPHLAFWLAHYAGTGFGALLFSSGGGKVMGTDGTLRLIRKLKPDVVMGIPTFLYHVLSQAVAEKLRWENLRCLALGGEKVSDGLRLKLRELARELGSPRVDVQAIYGFTECKMAWAECPFPSGQPSAGYHLCPDLGIVEIVDPQTGEVRPPGQPGEIVYTPLDARGSVILRYRTGDYIDGGLTYEPCPYCHRIVPRLVGRISRSSEIKAMNLDKIKGTLVDFNELEHILDDAPHIGAWQVELRKANDDPLDLDEIILHVTKVNGVDETQLRRELSERCYNYTDVHPNRIVFHDAEEMKRLQGVGVQIKEQKLVDHRPKTEAENQTGSAP
jgi:phenylacetate-coenzyme A ligase PaaK-like adenylate-forming protein